MDFDIFDIPADVSREDLRAAMVAYIRQNDNWYAHAYDLWLRAESYDEKYKATKDKPGAANLLKGPFLRAAYGYERNALRAQAYQTYRTAVAQNKKQDDYGMHDNAYLAPHGELMEMIRALSVKRQNIANGHAHLYTR